MTTPEQAKQEAAAAAQAAAAVLPAAMPLTPGPASRDPEDAALRGQAVCARFAGEVQGEVVAVVAQAMVDALRNSPIGELDVAQAVQPALEAAAGTFGTVVVDPATVQDPAVALGALSAKGEPFFIPLYDAEGLQAAVAVVVTGRSAAPEPSFPAGAVSEPPTPVAPEPVPPAAAPAPVPAAVPGPPPGVPVGGGVSFGGGPATANPFAAMQGVATPSQVQPAGLDLLQHLEMEVSAELGRTRMTVRELLSLGPGAVVELDRAAGSPADLLVNGRLVACGEVVVIDENFGLRITQIFAHGERS